jgi:nucleoside-triphosphatase THEP1
MAGQGTLTLITGEIESGKTRFCRQFSEALKELGWDTAGILSPAVFNKGVKTAIDGLDLRSGKRVRIAELNTADAPQMGPHTKRWRFSTDALEWCNEILKASVPCDFLVIDELGPLEFERGQGLLAAFEAVDSRKFKACLVVVRPSLVEKARRRWPEADVITIGEDMDISALVQQRLRLQ